MKLIFPNGEHAPVTLEEGVARVGSAPDCTIVLTAPAATSVTVSSISQDNPGIAASIDPALPAVVLDGQTVRLTVSWRVTSCVIAASVHTGDGVEITASANQAVQTWHAGLGAQFTKDLDTEVSTVCSGG